MKYRNEKDQLLELQHEHRSLDNKIARLQRQRVPCSLTLRDLKRRKLRLKDKIDQIQRIIATAAQ